MVVRTIIGIIAGILYLIAIVSLIGAVGSHGQGVSGYVGSISAFGFAALLSGVICIMDKLDDLIEEMKNSNDIKESTLLKIAKEDNSENTKKENIVK